MGSNKKFAHMLVSYFYRSQKRRPIALKCRSSSWMITFVIGLGIAVDLLVYSIIVPVMPFHLERLGYSNVAELTGWLLFAYSAGLVLCTIPIAMLSERYKARKIPLIFGLLVLVASQVVLMEAPNYAVMCIARILQGFGSSMVWVVGLALLCDSSPTSIIGLQLGVAMGGLSVGIAIGPPVGGLLYSKHGYRGPFVFGIAATVLDLLGRLIIIERKDALVWGVDPTILSTGPDRNSPVADYRAQHLGTEELGDNKSPETQESIGRVSKINESGQTNTPEKKLSLLSVVVRLSKSSRALVALFLVFIYGIVYSSQEPSIPLHLQQVWNLNAKDVGLVFIAGVVPTLFSSPLAGYFSDKNGVEWITVLSLLLALPWWVIIIIKYRLALFVTAFAVQSFFTSGVISPLTAELAAVSRGLDGVGYAHVYGAFNLVYGTGTSVGPILGGQIYGHVRLGWIALCLLAAGLLGLSLVLAICFVGADPLLHRLRRRLQ